MNNTLRTSERTIQWSRRSIFGFFWIIVFLGLFLRLYNYFSIPLINPDGTLYIQQAKALYFGLHDHLIRCLPYLSSYPFFIVIGYSALKDWLLAAQGVSLFFGMLTFFPLFGLLRRFFDDTVSLLTLLIFAVLPAFVTLSQDAIRGPVYWFFSMMGLFLFIRHIERPQVLLPFATALCFIISAWTRIEGMLFILTAGLFILWIQNEKRWTYILSYLSPFLILAGILGLSLLIADHNSFAILKMDRLARPLEVYERYKDLRDHLKHLSDQYMPGFSPYFFDKVRNLIWLIALGTLAVQIIETLYHLFFVVLVMGFAEYRDRIFKDPRVLYLSGTAGLALLVLYAQIMYNWAMTSRFVPLFLFPAFVYLGAGMKRILRILIKRFALRPAGAITLICVVTLSLTLPKILIANYVEDKTYFKKIGQFIAQKEEYRRPVSIAGAFKHIRMIHFYSNIDYPGAPCFDTRCFLPKVDRNSFLAVKNAGYDYLIWDEKNWGSQEINNSPNPSQSGFIQLNTWQTERFGRMILYQVPR